MPAVQPFPYQGSKRSQAALINDIAKQRAGRLYEPFAGSAAVSLERLARDKSGLVMLNDSDRGLFELWKAIKLTPKELCDAYRTHHRLQADDPKQYFLGVRERYNREAAPADLLYLINRCVKGAVRYNRIGEFNQGPDNRRLGAHPDEVERRIYSVHALVRNRSEIKNGDFVPAMEQATPEDIVYLDPPYQGTSEGRDGRYRDSLSRHVLIDALESLVHRDIPFILSYDGKGPAGEYGDVLPERLARCIEVGVGRSAQATLLGRNVETVERLYVSHNLATLFSASLVARDYAQPTLL